MFLTLIALLVLGIVGGSGPPDVDGFTPVLSKELEFRIDDYKTGLVGRVIVYQNPNDQNEFVRVYYRQVAIFSERAQEKNSIEAGSRDTNLSNSKYHSQEEAEALGRVQQSTDIFAYVQWRTTRDSRTGQDITDGYFRAGLLEKNGNWTVSSGYDLYTSPFSEPSKANPEKRVIVGIEFSLVGTVHIIRIDQDDMSALSKGAVNDKK